MSDQKQPIGMRALRRLAVVGPLTVVSDELQPGSDSPPCLGSSAAVAAVPPAGLGEESLGGLIGVLITRRMDVMMREGATAHDVARREVAQSTAEQTKLKEGGDRDDQAEGNEIRIGEADRAKRVMAEAGPLGGERAAEESRIGRDIGTECERDRPAGRGQQAIGAGDAQSLQGG